MEKRSNQDVKNLNKKNQKHQQELIFEFSMLEQQIRELQQQLQAVEQGIVEMGSLSLGLEELIGSKDKEILASIGRGIFAKAKLTSEKLVVDIGGKNFVKKSIPETKKIISEQINKLEGVKRELNENLEKVSKKLVRLMN